MPKLTNQNQELVSWVIHYAIVQPQLSGHTNVFPIPQKNSQHLNKRLLLFSN